MYLCCVCGTCRHFLRDLRERQQAIKLVDESAAEVVKEYARKYIETHVQKAINAVQATGEPSCMLRTVPPASSCSSCCMPAGASCLLPCSTVRTCCRLLLHRLGRGIPLLALHLGLSHRLPPPPRHAAKSKDIPTAITEARAALDYARRLQRFSNEDDLVPGLTLITLAGGPLAGEGKAREVKDVFR